MEYDLLFTFIKKEDWKLVTQSGYFKPTDLENNGYITCIEGKFAETYANLRFNEFQELLLIVIDPLRIHQPIKKAVDQELELLNIQGEFSIDAIIDRIPIQQQKDGTFKVRVKHFD